MATQRKACSDHAFHVDHNKALERWEVIDQDGREITHRHSQSDAIAIAIREAEHADDADGTVVVCVQQPDGHYALAWSSR